MSKGDHLGEFEILVLMALLRLGDDAYGIAILNELERQAARKASIGAVYATLDRLQRKQLVRSSKGEPTPERGGRAKRYFAITALGERRLKQSLKGLSDMAKGVLAWP